MQRIVINTIIGGFGLSYKAVMRYAELKGISLFAYFGLGDNLLKWDGCGANPLVVHYSTIDHGDIVGDALYDSYWVDDGIDRNDPALVQVIEELGDAADGPHAKLRVIYIPDVVKWEIAEYNGNERIAEKHRTWG